MGKELEPADSPTDLQPMYGPGGYDGGGSYGGGDGPDWMDAVPPYGPSDGFKDQIDRAWSYIIRGPRYVLRFMLWSTYTAWTFVFLYGTAAFIIMLVVKK